jgi:hypothetical protein
MPLKMPQMQGAREPEKRSVLPVREHFQATEQRRRWGIFSGIRNLPGMILRLSKVTDKMGGNSRPEQKSGLAIAANPLKFLVEMGGLEPPTSTLRTWRSPS